MINQLDLNLLKICIYINIKFIDNTIYWFCQYPVYLNWSNSIAIFFYLKPFRSIIKKAIIYIKGGSNLKWVICRVNKIWIFNVYPVFEIILILFKFKKQSYILAMEWEKANLLYKHSSTGKVYFDEWIVRFQNCDKYL